jgi:hypothetical protein
VSQVFVDTSALEEAFAFDEHFHEEGFPLPT